ncbi:carboxypeptidase regulatory-like domain-containing protein [Gillisia limnaea]|uniref:PEGA domain protein n=1 Tax=Gillisia limnaea (strain DSM 15749 / LMG 21470 / R-8282) TaxID=865937 RepID=H2BS50_GILLR|nr:carboxypeptidase regulatory-like domain-containing protein [Gillisia limnaea]EHQ03576.1 PEGA domain protein [Gillisia limnaea DSM 15749]
MKTIKYFSILLCVLFIGCSEDTLDEDTGRGVVTGTVVMDGSNEPVDNVRISTNPTTSTVFTDESGNFTINNVPEGDYSIQARKEGLVTSFEGATVLSNAEVNVILELKTEDQNNRQPSTPQLITPADNSEGQNLSVEFAWSASDPEEDELSFELELRNDRNNDILTFNNIADTTYTVENLNYGYKYFWQVRVSDSVNNPVQSAVYSFKTLEIPKSRIVYVREINGNNVIFTRDENNTEYQITSSNTNSFRPRKNNSTDKIAFLRTVGGQTQLFTMNLDGSQQFQVTSNIPVNGFNMDKVDFSWANDGASLVYPNFEKLYSIQATGGGNTLIYQAPSGRFITEVDVSEDNTLLALLTNNAQGYNASIYTIDASGNVMDSVIAGLPGALGGIDISVDKKRLLFTRDVSGFENSGYRQLDSRLFLYDFRSNMSIEISYNKEEGTNDLDPRFSPDEAEVIFVNASNDGLSESNIYKSQIEDNQTQNVNNRQELYQNAMMPDWE